MTPLRDAKEAITRMVHSEAGWVNVDVYPVLADIAFDVVLSVGDVRKGVTVREMDLYAPSENDSVDQLMDAVRAMPSGFDLVEKGTP